jgi:histidinol-phosphate aminotransferase
MTDELSRPHLAAVSAYVPGKPIEELERELGVRDAIKLASNENPVGPSPMALRAVEQALARAHRYPDGDAHALRTRLAELHDVSAGEIAFGNGSNELIDLLCRSFAGPEHHAVIAAPSFVAYELCLAINDIRRTTVPLDKGVFWNPDTLLAAVRPNTRLLFVDNPNNPVSTHLGRAGLTHLLQQLPGHVIPVIDEAYIHYVDAPDYVSALELRGVNPRLIVLRTFSKAFGLAALRAGYAVGPASLLSDIEKVRAPFNLNSLAQAGALAALDDREHVARVVELNRSQRQQLTAALAALGFEVAPSQANFVFVELPASYDSDAATLYRELLTRGVIVRGVAGSSRHLRVTVGLPEENQRLLEALRVAVS